MWDTLEFENEVHITPKDDLVRHETGDDCICGPLIEPRVRYEDGSIWWLIVHHSLDNREANEEDIEEV